MLRSMHKSKPVEPGPTAVVSDEARGNPRPTDSAAAFTGGWREDLMALTKARLSLLVLVTVAAGFVMGSAGGDGFGWWAFLHTLIGTGLVAAACSVFNQIMETEADARMQRTADRPLPAGRMNATAAFIVGWLLAAIGIVHLANLVNTEASMITAATLVVYVFVYTPLKTRSTSNTLVGAVSGALPPVAGWAAAAGPVPDDFAGLFRWELLWQPGALFLFLLLLFWQLPHFLAINWLYRDQYRDAGFVMWSNQDESGRFTGGLALAFTLPMVPLMWLPLLLGHGVWPLAVGGTLVSMALLALALKFFRSPSRTTARRLFFGTLLYLPLVLLLAVIDW